MHPAVIIVPVAVLIFGPQLWVKRVMKRHNSTEESHFPTGGELARELLARHELHGVKVEKTDIGDHYDPKAKAVRLTRDKFDRKTLTAMTTAAHEVAHAVQDASGYGWFIWRMRLVKVAQVAGQAGTVVIMAVPAAALVTPYRVPPLLIGSAIFAMLTTGLAAQVAALPTELDASFGRAMPMLRDGYINEPQAKNAREILVASSLTYLVASLLAVLNFWPWMGVGGPTVRVAPPDNPGRRLAGVKPIAGAVGHIERPRSGAIAAQMISGSNRSTILKTLARQIGKPLIRVWFQIRLPLS